MTYYIAITISDYIKKPKLKLEKLRNYFLAWIETLDDR